MEVEGEKISPFSENIFLRRRAFTRLYASASIIKATIVLGIGGAVLPLLRGMFCSRFYGANRWYVKYDDRS